MTVILFLVLVIGILIGLSIGEARARRRRGMWDTLALVTAAQEEEREACATIAERHCLTIPAGVSHTGALRFATELANDTCAEIATKIRERGQPIPERRP